MTTAAAKIEVEGFDATPRIGSLVRPDNWSWSMPLAESDWAAAAFRITSARFQDRSMAVNVKVTGRTIQYLASVGRCVRVQITFVGDGEPDVTHGGYMVV